MNSANTQSYAKEVGDDYGEAHDRFEAALAALPQPGVGGGYHGAILGAANHGVRAGLAPEEVFAAIRRFTRPGGRKVSDQEIADAVAKAVGDARVEPGERLYRARPEPWFDAAAFFDRLQQEAGAVTEADIVAASPVRIENPGPAEAGALLRALYPPDAYLFAGERFDTQVRRVAEWTAAFEAGEPVPPHIIPNPLSGAWGLSKRGELSFRADACVQDFRLAVAEFDDRTRDEQMRFFAAVDLPIVAIIDSGGKSLHGWIRIDGIADADAWERDVENGFFARWLVPLGVDSSCKNESRLSRLPGHFRAETGRWQRLLYLAPAGRRVRV